MNMPFMAISNNNFRGETPQALLDLNQVELAFLCPVRTFGHCFQCVGGHNMNLKGTLGFYRVDVGQVVQGVSFVKSLGANVVILINGGMTTKQHAKARSHSKLCVDMICEAVF